MSKRNNEPSTRITVADLEAMIAKPNHAAEKRKPPELPLPELDADGRVLYFAYGSNLDHDQMRSRCPTARALYPAVIKGWRIDFCGFSRGWDGGVATIVPDADASVEGVIWSLTADDVRSLDRAEGAPFVYEREELSVAEDDGRERLCITYAHTNPAKRMRPGKIYYRQIFDAYKREGFDTAPLRAARDSAPRKLPPPATVAPAKRGVPDRVPTLEDNMCTDELPNLVFVYGSLMHGYGNHNLLVRHGAEFVGEDYLRTGFTMLDVGAYPGVIDSGEQAIFGELYRVDDATLADLDILEGAPNYYHRKRVRTAGNLRAWVYILRPDHARGLAMIDSGSWREHRAPTPSRKRPEWPQLD